MMPTVGEPAPEVQESPAGEVQEGSAQEVAASALPDETVVEIEAADGSKQQITLKELRETYVDRDRHRKAADQKFTEADKVRKGVQGEVQKALQDPRHFLKFVEEKRGDFKALDFYFQQLEEAGDPQVIDRLAQLLEAKLKKEEAEKSMSPEARRVRELEAENKKLQAQWEERQDREEETALFEGVKGAVMAAGLNPSPLVAMMALEIIAEARANGEELKNEEAAILLKEHFRDAAEGLFKPQAEQGEGKARDPSTGQFQAKAKAAPGAADAGAAAQAKRTAKESTPRVSVVKQPGKKKEEAAAPERKSFLEAMLEHAYSGIR